MHSTVTQSPRTLWVGLIACAWSLLFVWQGLDFTDMGFWLTSFQQHYTCPEAIPAPCWLSSFIGHRLGAALGGSVVAYKLAHVAVVTTLATISYRLLAAKLGPSRPLAAAVLLTVAFTRVFGGNWVDYYDLTALFYLGGAALLFGGLVQQRKLLVLLAGMVLGANAFVRLPNVLGIALVSGVWLYVWANRGSWRDVLVGAALFLGGFLLGAALIWGLIVWHGHEALYLHGLQVVFGWAADSSSHHAGSDLLYHFIADQLVAFKKGFLLLVLGGGMAFWTNRQNKFVKLTVCLVGAGLLANILQNKSQWRHVAPGFCYLLLLAVALREFREDRRLALLAFLGGMVLVLVPLGSGSGIAVSMYGMWLALPLSLLLLWRQGSFAIKRIVIEPQVCQGLALTIALALLFQSLVSAWRYTFLDSSNRLVMTHPINHPHLAGTYTTAARAKVVAELLEAMARFTKPGDAVLAYNGIPTVHFLTETHPWLGNPWPDMENAGKLAALVRQKEQTNALPVTIVRASGSTYAYSWPANPQPVADWWGQKEARQVFVEFELRHQYRVVWTNDFFEILTPVQRQE